MKSENKDSRKYGSMKHPNYTGVFIRTPKNPNNKELLYEARYETPEGNRLTSTWTTEREAAVAHDKFRLVSGVAPVNILTRKK